MDSTGKFPIIELGPNTTFPQFAELPQPPKRLFMRGSLDSIAGKKIVSFVGSRACTGYGKQACRSIIDGLRGYPIVIASGLAIGIDSIAHEAALDAGLATIALPGSGLGDRALYPAQHRDLAGRILRNGGVLLSEYPPDTRAMHWMFPQRNRLMAGIADVVVVIEAEEQSGTLITARLAAEYNKIVCALPGPITSPTSKGANWLLKLGAVPITEAADIIRELQLDPDASPAAASATAESDTLLNAGELRVLAALTEPKSRDQLIRELALEPAAAAIIFSTLEIKGVIRETLGQIEKIA